MENIDIHGLESSRKPNRIPIQLPLIWSEASDEAATGSPPLLDKSGKGADPPTNLLQQNDMIAAQAGRTKTVCLTLLGIGLIALHFY